MAVLVYVAVEEWQWDRIECFAVPGGRYMPTDTRPTLSTRSQVKYGFEVGLPRMRDILKDRGIRATMLTTGTAIDQHPQLVAQLADQGHEICAHGRTQGAPLSTMSREEQKDNIRKTIELVEGLIGKRPKTWLGPVALCDEDTIELVAQEGFICHGDLQDDELPYFIDVNGKTIVELSYRMVGNVNDNYMTIYQPKPHLDDLIYHMKSTFDAYYREASVRPLMFNYGTHPFNSGRPDTAYAFGQFLDYMRRYDDVWITTYSEVAEWWMKRFAEGY